VEHRLYLHNGLAKEPRVHHFGTEPEDCHRDWCFGNKCNVMLLEVDEQGKLVNT